MNRKSTEVGGFSKHHYDGAFQPLPEPAGPFPFRFDLEDMLGRDTVDEIRKHKKLVFHAVGDTGNRNHGAEAQESVAYHMEQQYKPLHQEVDGSDRLNIEGPVFFYHLGDVVYFNGEKDLYQSQFYDPYQHYPGPIVAIAGNHDGASPRGGPPSLEGFMENFCSAQPRHTWMAGPSNRTTMIQPNVYWTLCTPLCRIIGLYSNVPGQLDKRDKRQQRWLTHELSEAKNEKCVIVAVHHPPYSLDDTHGGHQPIEQALD